MAAKLQRENLILQPAGTQKVQQALYSKSSSTLKTVLLLFHLCLSANASPVSEYDKTIAEVFEVQHAVSEEISRPDNLEERKKQWLEFKHIQDLNLKNISNASFQYKHQKTLDLEALASLDLEAAKVWNSLLDCNNGDASRARSTYVSNNICSSAKEEISNLRSSVQLFLSSTNSQSLDYKKTLFCKDNDRKSFCEESFDYPFSKFAIDNFYGGTSIYLSTRNLTNIFKLDIHKIIDEISVPQLHPLLRQQLLEHIAYGYPVPFGTYSCGGPRCALAILFFQIPEKIMLETPVEWSARGYIPDHSLEKFNATAIRQVQQIFDGQSLPKPNEIPSSNIQLQNLRRSFAAIHILSFTSLGKQNCNKWGLWPNLSMRLLSALSASSVNYAGREFSNDEVDRILLRVNESCNQELPKIYLRAGVMGNDLSFDHLSEIGAWRKLLENSN